MLVLASQSPRRAALLRAAGVAFRVIPAADEEALPLHTRRAAVLATGLALRKALDVAARTPGTVLAADTIVVCQGRVLGKPGSMAEARQTLRFLSGRRHSVYTGVALVSGRRHLVGYERTEVAFRGLTEADIRRYLATGEPMDKAGAYGIQGEGAALVAAVHGCYTNVIGLPLPKVLALLAAFHQ